MAAEVRFPNRAGLIRVSTAMHKLLATLSMMFLLTGCMLRPVNPNAPIATDIDPKSALNDYWYKKPAVVSVEAAHIEPLWNAAVEATKERSFIIDRRDFREGWLSTQPLVSKQPFEFWRGDVVSPVAELQCTLSTMRRTVRFHFTRTTDGKYICEPKVVVERYAMPERRITAVDQYLEAFTTLHAAEDATTEEGQAIRVEYWYADGRDYDLERVLAESIRNKLDAAQKGSAILLALDKH